jgi:tyrosine-protein kinase Etk/Wzc
MSGGVRLREVPGPQAASDGELDIGAVGRVLWRKKWWVLIPALIVAVVTFIGVNLIAPRFKSEARVLIDARENVFLRPEAEKAGDRERATVDPEAVQSQVQLVLSRDLARQVVKQLKLNERPEFDPILRGFNPLRHVLMLVGLAKDPLRMTPEERILESYYERVNAYPIDKSRVIAVEFQSSDPELAARGANAIAEAYLELQQTVKMDQTRSAGRWLAGEIEGLRGKVAEAEAKVEDFRAKQNLFVGTSGNTLSNQQLAEVNSQLAVARSQKAEADAKARSIRDMLKSGRAIETGDVAASELIRRLNEQRVTLRAQLAEQSSTLLDAHPRIKELKAQIGDLERQIRVEAEKLVRSLENDAKIAGARVDQLAANFDALKRQAASTNEQDVQLRALEREAKAQRDLLESYLAKYREASARESLGATPADARVISRAIVSNTPHFPKKVPIVLIATLATLLLGVGFITTGELLAGNVYRPSLVAHPAVLLPEAGAAEPRWVAADEAPVAAAEPAAQSETAGAGQSIADLAASLHAAGDGARRIMVVGLAEDAETGGTATALARALAAHGRVVLLDLAFGDPKPAAPSAEGVMPGISDLVRGTASFGQIIARDRASRAHLIGAGRVGADSASVLQSERLAIAIDALGRSYDHVVVDTGAMPELPTDRLARLASYAVVVTTGAAADVVQLARDELTASGFAGVTTFDVVAADAGAVEAPRVGAVAA